MKYAATGISIILLAGISWLIFFSGIVLNKKVDTMDKEQPNPTTPISSDTQESSAEVVVVLETTLGSVEITLDKVGAPVTSANFEKLVRESFYDLTKFHRVIEGFMIQGGDPFSKDDALADRWGTGGPGYKFADEIHANNRNNIGTIAMANAGPGTNGSQFFINVANNNFLDTKHTVFGRVTAGMEIVNKISVVQTAPGDRPIESVIINKAYVKTSP